MTRVEINLVSVFNGAVLFKVKVKVIEFFKISIFGRFECEIALAIYRSIRYNNARHSKPQIGRLTSIIMRHYTIFLFKRHERDKNTYSCASCFPTSVRGVREVTL